MGVNLTKFLWNKLPESLQEKDNGKDINGKGILERYLSIFEIELNEEVVPKLESIIDELDPETATNTFLSEIAFMVARPKDILEDLNIYRTVLKQIITLYQIKGTSKSYQLFFNLLGMEASIIEHFPADVVYDNGLIYDDDSEDAVTYDQTSCEVGCIDYSIVYSNLPGKDIAPLTGTLRDNVIAIIEEFLQPIDCNLRELIYEDNEIPLPPFVPPGAIIALNRISNNISIGYNTEDLEVLPPNEVYNVPEVEDGAYINISYPPGKVLNITTFIDFENSNTSQFTNLTDEDEIFNLSLSNLYGYLIHVENP